MKINNPKIHWNPGGFWICVGILMGSLTTGILMHVLNC